jgi:hypothetical protein
MERLQPLFMMPGLCAPFIAAMIMIHRSKSPELWRDYWDRLLNFKRVKSATVPVMLLLMPAVILDPYRGIDRNRRPDALS